MASPICPRIPWRLWGAAGLLFFLACQGGAAKRESVALTEAVDRYRNAEDAAKSERAQGVLAIACTDATVCDVKRICMAAIEPTTKALALKNEVAQRLNDLDRKKLSPDSPEVAELPGKLDDATRMLQEGRAKMGDCDKRLAELRVQFGG
jgi:hypothetical protein